MNLNILGYLIYLSFTCIIIIKVGKLCYDNGNLFVSQLIPNHEALCHQINKMLLSEVLEEQSKALVHVCE